MSGVVDRYRRFVVDDAPVATGFVAVADAWACTNPSAGRGLTVGFLQAVALRDTLREIADDPVALVEEYDRVTERDVAPWYHSQIAVDRARFAEIEALRAGREPAPPADELARQFAALVGAAVADPDLFRAAIEYVGTITPLQELFRRPELAERVRAIGVSLPGAPPFRMPGPDRAELLAILA
jgi:hypothetical protein